MLHHTGPSVLGSPCCVLPCTADFFLVLLALIFFLIIGDNDIVIMCTMEFGLIIRANVVN